MEADNGNAGICPRCGTQSKVRRKTVKGYQILLWKCSRCRTDWADIGGEVTRKNDFAALKNL